MKKIVLGILVGFLLIVGGCNDDDGYSLSDQWLGFGVLQKSDAASPSETPIIVMDNKDVLIPIASNYPTGWLDRYEHGERILVNYTILDEVLESSTPRFYVKINQIEDILMKGVMDITPENEDSIGNDAIIVQDYWMTDSLLNFKLKYWGYNKVHFLNLVKQPGEISLENQPVELELRHNANNDDEAILYTAYVSFSLNSLRIAESDSIQFVFTSTDYKGKELSEEGIFNYGDLN